MPTSLSDSTVSRRIVLGLTGASGMPYAIRLWHVLAATPDIELHAIVSDAAVRVLALESDTSINVLLSLAYRVYPIADVGAPPGSGSWPHYGMVVCPCSMASLAAIAHGLGSNLIHRAADVTLKERRPCILVPRETPYNAVHLRNMIAAHEAGATILAASPGFYRRPDSIVELVDGIVGHILDLLDIEQQLVAHWKG
ncbi:Flavin prenyltransferase LpdB [Desulfovibrionales bacterium]